MMRRFPSSARLLVFSTLALALGLASPGRLLAGSLPPWAANTEIMMNTEGAEMTFIGRYFGPDNSSTLSFTSNQDIANQTFSFGLNPGATYLGQSMTLNASGSYDASMNQWDITTNGSLGSSTWSSEYTASITGDPLFVLAGKITVPLPGFPLLDIELSGALVVYTAPPPIPLTLIGSIATAQATVLGVGVGPKFGVVDAIANFGGWTLGTGGVFLAGVDANGGGHDFQVASSGQVTPMTGGLGSFTAQVQTVPEPSTAVLFIFGMMGMGVIGRKSWLRHRISRRDFEVQPEGC